MQIVNTAAGGGRRTLWDADLMDAYYDPPGIVFEGTTDHDHATDHPVAECRKEVGEKLCERAHIEALTAVVDDDGNETAEADEAAQQNPDVPVDHDARGRIDAADYRTLQLVAEEFGGIAANQSTDDLRDALHDADAAAVNDAFAAVAVDAVTETENEEE